MTVLLVPLWRRDPHMLFEESALLEASEQAAALLASFLSELPTDIDRLTPPRLFGRLRWLEPYS